MKEKSGLGILDQYFRRKDTLLARSIKTISKSQGRDHRNSRLKRGVDLLIATPLAIATLPVVGVLSSAKKLEDGGSAFYRQERIGQGGKPFVLLKIRAMRMNVDSDVSSNLTNQVIFGKENDPRNTRLGRFMRRYQLEELPQLWQVVSGQLSLVDVRCLPKYVFDYLERVRPETFNEWKKAYLSGRPGLLNLNAVLNHSPDDRFRYHFDIFYAKKATLGLDLYIIYRTAVRMLDSFRRSSLYKQPKKSISGSRA